MWLQKSTMNVVITSRKISTQDFRTEQRQFTLRVSKKYYEKQLNILIFLVDSTFKENEAFYRHG